MLTGWLLSTFMWKNKWMMSLTTSSLLELLFC